MFATKAGTRVDVTAHFNVLAPLRSVGTPVSITLIENSYAPKFDPAADWIAQNFIPALIEIRNRRTYELVATIGTGDGRDALALIEVLRPKVVFLTDLEADVVDNAVNNVVENLIGVRQPVVFGRDGDLLVPLRGAGRKFDLIYENLPNIPAGDAPENDVRHGQNAATFHVDRAEAIPHAAATNLLALHYLALQQAKALLSPGGILLMSIGQRRPLSAVIETLSDPDYDISIANYGWKLQSEAGDVVRGYAAYEQQTGVRFSFYDPQFLMNAFHGRSTAENVARAFEIAEAVAPRAMTAEEALVAVNRGEQVAHTVLMLAATLRNYEGKEDATRS